jgi:hypothetical protein
MLKLKWCFVFHLLGCYSGEIVKSEEEVFVADRDKLFENLCNESPNALLHPKWYFTRDKWIRTPMDESRKSDEKMNRFSKNLPTHSKNSVCCCLNVSLKKVTKLGDD